MQITVKKFNSNPAKSIQAQMTISVCEECFNICFVGRKIVAVQVRLEGNGLHIDMLSQNFLIFFSEIYSIVIKILEIEKQLILSLERAIS